MTSKNEKDLRKQRQPRNKKDAKDKVRNEEDKEKGVKRSSRSTTAAIRGNYIYIKIYFSINNLSQK